MSGLEGQKAHENFQLQEGRSPPCLERGSAIVFGSLSYLLSAQGSEPPPICKKSAFGEIHL